MSNKEIVKDLLRRLPEGASLHDIAREIEFVAGVRERLNEPYRGERISFEQAAGEFSAAENPASRKSVQNFRKAMNKPLRKRACGPTRRNGRHTEGRCAVADLDPTQGSEQAGRRPVVVLSEDVFNERSGTVIAMAITSRQPRVGFPLVLELSDGLLPKRSWVKISQIRTLSVKRLGAKIAQASDAEVAQLIEGLNEILGV